MSENKPDLMAELAEVVRLCDAASAMLPSPEGNEAIKLAETSATNWVITHHAEIAAAVRDAARYRWLRDYGGNGDEGLAVSTKDDFILMGKEVDTAIDTAMRAGEGEG